jgi:hypothetical protein
MPDRRRGGRYARRLVQVTIRSEMRGAAVMKIQVTQRLAWAMGEKVSIEALDERTDETYHQMMDRAMALLKMCRGPE